MGITNLSFYGNAVGNTAGSTGGGSDGGGNAGVETTLVRTGNKLVYTNNNGVRTIIDLSVFMDDTNAAVISSGVLDGDTGTVTYTRDDDSTFDVDLSALLDDTRVTVSNDITSTSTTEAASMNVVNLLKEPVAKIKVRQTNDALSIVLPATKKDQYIEYMFSNTPDATIGSDVWRVSRANVLDKDLGLILNITNEDEWETAIKQAGHSDYMGGNAHGDEIKTSVTCLVDGLKRDITINEEYEADTVLFTQTSELFETDTNQANKLATYTKVWEWDIVSRTMTISHKINWLAGIEIVDAYLAMLPIQRTDANDNTISISDAGMRSPYYIEEDLSQAGHAQTFTDSSRVLVWGSVSGVSAEVEVVDGWTSPNRELFISGAAQYNKIYFDFTGAGYTTQIGETFTAKIKYKLDVE